MAQTYSRAKHRPVVLVCRRWGRAELVAMGCDIPVTVLQRLSGIHKGAGRRAGLVGDAIARQHTRDFVDPRRSIERHNS